MSACAVTPPEIVPVITPDEYIFAHRGDTLLVVGVEWWEVFGDTTLNRLILTAIETNQDLAVALSNVEIARQTMATARASLLPQVDVGVSGSATYTTPSDGGKKRIAQSYSLLPRASWELSLFGAGATTDAAREEFLASEWGYRAARLTLEAEVATTYFEWLQYARSLEISERS